MSTFWGFRVAATAALLAAACFTVQGGAWWIATIGASLWSLWLVREAEDCRPGKGGGA